MHFQVGAWYASPTASRQLLTTTGLRSSASASWWSMARPRSSCADRGATLRIWRVAPARLLCSVPVLQFNRGHSALEKAAKTFKKPFNVEADTTRACQCGMGDVV